MRTPQLLMEESLNAYYLSQYAPQGCCRAERCGKKPQGRIPHCTTSIPILVSLRAPTWISSSCPPDPVSAGRPKLTS